MIGYHASHEQYSPGDLLRYIALAQSAGFQAVMASDHLAPWTSYCGNSGHIWSWLGAATQVSTLPFGCLAIPIGLRYHPAIIAQAAATLKQMNPKGLQWIAAGSGEALNEQALGYGWPDKAERHARLLEGVTMIRRLWNGETLTKNDGFIHADRLKIWSLPEIPPKIFAAALTPETAYWAGGWADGLITIRKPPEEIKETIRAFHDGGGKGKPLTLQMQIHWAKTEEQAVMEAWKGWRSTVLDPQDLANMPTPQDFDRATQSVTPDDIGGNLFTARDARSHIDLIREYCALGFQDIYIHNACRDQEGFINFYGTEILPSFMPR